MSESLAQKIKRLRKQKDMTLEQVGAIVGVGKSTVRKWETGMIANVKGDKIALLAQALSTTPEYLMGWDLQSQIDSLAAEIEQLKKEVATANAEDIEDLEYTLAIKEEAHEDLVLALRMNELAQKNNSPTELKLSEGEVKLIELLRKVPADRQQLVLQMIETALRNL